MPGDPSTRELNRATLARQLLLERAGGDVVEAVGRLGALQAQEPRPPFVALWSRLEGFAADDLNAAIAAKTLVRGTLMRGTVHVARAEDFLAWQPLLAPFGVEAMRTLLGARIAGVDVDAIVADARELFADGRALSAKQLRDELAARHPDADVRAVAAISRYSLPLVRVPEGGRWGFKPTSPFTDAHAWLGRDPVAAPDLDALVRAYLAAFGPATPRDAAQWLGGDVRAGFEQDGLLRLGSYYDLPDAPRPGADAEAPVRFLADFDSLVLAHADRSRVIADEHRKALTTKNPRVRATVLVDGMVAGFWTIERKRVVVEPLRQLRAAERRAVDAEAERLAAFAA